MNYEQSVTDDEQQVGIAAYRGPLQAANIAANLDSKAVEGRTPASAPHPAASPLARPFNKDKPLIMAVIGFGISMLATLLLLTLNDDPYNIPIVLFIFSSVVGVLNGDRRHQSSRPRLVLLLTLGTLIPPVIAALWYLWDTIWFLFMFLLNFHPNSPM